jgi:hypothetical protein
VFVNPRIEPEIYYDNNLLQLNNYLNVEADKFGPVLEVTIDGRFVKNGDYVSANPLIKVLLWDENSFLLKQDTTGIGIYLQYPCGVQPCNFTPIYLNRSDVTVVPATSSSEFYIEFRPENLPTGEYKLQVEARDVVGNLNAEDPFSVEFIVTDEMGINLDRPYPNPSLGLVHFPVIVTGSEIPVGMNVKIVSSSGLEVADFSFDNFFVGTNDIVWNCRDALGNQLPVGLYLYRVQLVRPDNSVRTLIGKLILTK